MAIKNPIFTIPAQNKIEQKKPGGGQAPPYLGNKNKFEQHKRKIVASLDSLINLTRRTKPRVSSPDQLNFFELELHNKAISKSAQPVELLDRNNIQVLSQTNENTFIVSATESNLIKFRDSTSRFSLQENKNDSAFLSAITKVDNVSKEVRFSKAEFPEDKKYHSYIFLFDSLSVGECQKIYAGIKSISDKHSEFFVTESGAKAIFGSFSRSFLDEISEPHPANPIQKIEKSLFFTVQESPTIPYDLDDVNVIEPDSEAKVAIIDTGVADHFLFKNLIIGSEDFINDPQRIDLSHGTFVGSRTVFGETLEDQIFSSKTLFAQVKILDVRIMKSIDLPDGRKICGVSDKDLVAGVKTIVEKYCDQIKVYNLSLNFEDTNCIHSGIRHYISRELDSLAYKYKVIFVVSAGNNESCLQQSYPDCFQLPENVITPPADLVNGLVVGSITDNESSKSIALDNEPSPFTRVGLVGTKKPDLVHFGGNLNKYGQVDGLGVKGLSIDGKGLTEGIGTSFSAPVVSQIVAKVYDYLSQSNMWSQPSIDLARALTLHSGVYNLPPNSKIDPSILPNIVGFGVPDFRRALDCFDSQATFVFTDILGVEIDGGDERTIKANKHKIKFLVPPELIGKKKRTKVKATLVYTPLTNSSDSVDYSLVDIELNLHYINSKGTPIGGKLTSNGNDFRIKWNPIKSFEKEYTAYLDGHWEIWLTLNARGKANNKNYEQPYALVVSIEDATSDPSKRINLYEVIKNQHTEYVQIKPSLRVRS